MRKILTLISVLIFSNLNSQIASMEAYVIQDGKDGDYRKIESFVAPLKVYGNQRSKLLRWAVMKKIRGDLSSIDNSKEMANYLVFNVYKDQSQMDSDDWNNYRGYASKVYKGRCRKVPLTKCLIWLKEIKLKNP